MNQDLSILTLVTQASLVVQLVMAGLLIVSLTSWTVIFGKVIGLRRVRGLNEGFEREFWSGRSLQDLYQAAGTQPPAAPMGRIFASGMREFMKLRERRLDVGAQLDGARRAMRASYQRELDTIESHLSFLGSVASVSPYVLFGTVWGIMHALQDITKSGSASLDVVAGPIGEALVATAIGIAVAVPAVLAYNFFLRRMKIMIAELEDFATDFVNLALKTAWRLERPAGEGKP